MKHLLVSTILFSIAACQPAMATMPNAPRGAVATGCDLDEYEPVFGKNGNILYWLNPTCTSPESSSAWPSKDDWPEVPLPQHPGPGPGDDDDEDNGHGNDDDHDDEDNPGGGDKPKDNNGHGNGDEGDCSGSGCNDPDNPGNKPEDKPKKNK